MNTPCLLPLGKANKQGVFLMFNENKPLPLIFLRPNGKSDCFLLDAVIK